MSLNYRPEIDGLRAVAIVAVLLCHAQFSTFKGGYVGVDIFFVISGFLITSIIQKDLRAGTFSFTNFWERRIRRILPPLVLVVLATVAAGWFLHLPDDYAVLGQQVASQSLFSSNFLFKAQAGYFDSTSAVKPLLHTWSLAVEEQFYLLLPVAVYFVWKKRPDKLQKYLWICAIITFIAAMIIVRNSPSSAFYLLPFRAWELLIGSLLALRSTDKVISPRASDQIGFLGLAAILIAAMSYDEETLFPGFSALLPCLGAWAIIYSNSGAYKNPVGKVLSMKAPVFIGLISYSLYLWHWPIIAFVNYSGLIDFTPLIATLCILASGVLAVGSWKFIETPVRKKIVLTTTRQAYIFAVVSLVSMAAIGLGMYALKGIPQRLPDDVANYAKGITDTNPHRDECNKPKFNRFADNTICQLNVDSDIKPTFAIWGDSHADAIAPGFYDLAKKHHKNGYALTADGCPPILGFSLKSYKDFDCASFNEHALNLIIEKKIRNVVLIGSWMGRINGADSDFAQTDWYAAYHNDYSDITSAAMKRTIDELQKNKIKVYMMLDVPFAPFDPPRYLAMKSLYKQDALPETISFKAYQSARSPTIDAFVKKNKGSGVVFIDPMTSLCDEKECHVQKDGHSLYYNEGHLSAYGARYLQILFEPYVKNF